jgi:hypothetical protein
MDNAPILKECNDLSYKEDVKKNMLAVLEIVAQ